MAETRWLNAQERDTWLALLAVIQTLPGRLDVQLRRDHGLTMFEYSILAMLSESEDRTRPMTDLSVLTAGSLSRLSHAVRKLEQRGFVERAVDPTDRRITLAGLTPFGMERVVAAAPSHVATVRELVFDQIPPERVHDFLDLLQPIADFCHPALSESQR
jgi:DNA-binding MarR family transcriptional regulator